MTNCGPNGNDCCCTSPEVTDGTFYRDYDISARGYFVMAADAGPTDEAAPATVSGFRLDKYLVTVGRFRQFVAAWNGGWLPPAGSGRHSYLNGGLGLVNTGDDAGVEYETGWLVSDDGNIAPTNANLNCYPGYDTWTNAAGSQENLPLNCVSWYDAYAFCIWDGGFLPSEAEWEYAAAGGSQQREYPWGSTDPGTANEYAVYGCLYPLGDAGAAYLGPGECAVAPVGMAARGAGLWGQLDLAGNVSEWNLDWGVFTSITGIHYVDPCVDCANLSSEPPPSAFYGGRMAQGGDFTTPLSLISIIEAEQGNGGLPAGRYYGLGFRCARAP
jgi:formylglycine-generating enzyme